MLVYSAPHLALPGIIGEGEVDIVFERVQLCLIHKGFVPDADGDLFAAGAAQVGVGGRHHEVDGAAVDDKDGTVEDLVNLS